MKARFAALLLLTILLIRQGNGQGTAPAWDWIAATPGSQGISSSKIEALRESMATRKTKALLIIHKDQIICEWYAPGNSRRTKQGTASLAKALVGGLSLSVALTDGRISLN